MHGQSIYMFMEVYGILVIIEKESYIDRKRNRETVIKGSNASKNETKTNRKTNRQTERLKACMREKLVCLAFLLIYLLMEAAKVVQRLLRCQLS